MPYAVQSEIVLSPPHPQAAVQGHKLARLVTEKLLTFADAAASHPDFARELPVFVAEVRRIFAAQEIAEHLATLEHDRAAAADDVAAGEFNEDDDLNDAPDVVAARAERFATIKDVLLAGQLGIS